MKSLDSAARVIDAALDARAFSAVTVEVGRSHGVEWTHHGGRLSFVPDAPAVTADTIFDLASLTKVLATTTIGLGLVAQGRLDLAAPVCALLRDWSQGDRARVTVRDLFEHSSGLPAHRTYYFAVEGRTSYEAAIGGEPFDYAPRTQSIYSDLGFMLLAFILEDAGGAPLDEQFRRWRQEARIGDTLDFNPPASWKTRIACTEDDPWRGRLLQGEVHDENAAALGGVAGHAGLFGTAATVGEAARWWMQLLNEARDANATALARCADMFTRRSAVPGSSRAVGWDTMLPTSSCGTRLSSRAIGHTGFTGTSLWIDPEQDLYVVLLTNRVHPTRANDAIQKVRRDLHDAVVEGIG